MALLHKFSGNNRTFSDLSDIIFLRALHTWIGRSITDVVFDIYSDILNKNAERENRLLVLFNYILPGHKIQQWKCLLRCSSSKTALVKFLAEQWQQACYSDKLHEKEIYVIWQDHCVNLSRDGTAECFELMISQEEADTRRLLHAKHTSQNYEAIIIASDETDVLILNLAFSNHVSKMNIRCGTKNRIRYIDVSKLDRSMNENMLNSCVSAFEGRDKV